MSKERENGDTVTKTSANSYGGHVLDQKDVSGSILQEKLKPVCLLMV